jgi:hypothetical protein
MPASQLQPVTPAFEFHVHACALTRSHVQASIELRIRQTHVPVFHPFEHNSILSGLELTQDQEIDEIDIH